MLEGDQVDPVPTGRNAARQLLKEIEKAEGPQGGRGVASRANYGLLLGILACLLFKLSPLMAILSAVSLWYCGHALLVGLYRLRIIVYRALIGLALALISVGLHYLNLSGLLSEVITFL